jgi:HlyD family secretion protein
LYTTVKIWHSAGNPNRGSPLGAEALVVMGDTSKLRVHMDVDERDIVSIKIGSTAFVTAISLPGKRFSGKVVGIGRRMGRKNIRTDDPTERIDTKILELDAVNETFNLGLRVTSFVDR